MLDFDPVSSLNQDVFEYMTENDMYEKVSSSKETSIDFALTCLGRSLINAEPKESDESEGKKDAIYTLILSEKQTYLQPQYESGGKWGYIKCNVFATARTLKVGFLSKYWIDIVSFLSMLALQRLVK